MKVAIPTLAEVATEPERAATLPPLILTALIAQCAALEARLVSELALALHRDGTTPEPQEPTNWITPAEAARIANLPLRFFYSHRLRFVKRLSRKNVRIDETALRAWLESK